jgi:hypothetical protein
MFAIEWLFERRGFEMCQLQFQTLPRFLAECERVFLLLVVQMRNSQMRLDFL